MSLYSRFLFSGSAAIVSGTITGYTEKCDSPGVPGSPATFSVWGTEVSLLILSANVMWHDITRITGVDPLMMQAVDSLGRSLVLDVLLGVGHVVVLCCEVVGGANSLEVGLF